MVKMKRVLWILTIISALMVMGFSTVMAAERLTIVRVEDVPKIDGVLDDAVWELAKKNGSVIDTFYIFKALDKEASPGEVYICYDEDELYMAVICYGNTSRLKQTTILHDGPVYSDDDVEIFINPYLPEFNPGYQLIVNPRGTTFDAKFTRSYEEGVSKPIVLDPDWEPLWRIAVPKNHPADRWILEVAIPFDALEVDPPKEGDVWGFNITKRSIDLGQIGTWAKLPATTSHDPKAFNEIEFGPLAK